MEFIDVNLINTTTQLVVNSFTSAASNLFNRDVIYQYVSDGLATDGTISSIRINFNSTVSVSRILLQEMNWKDFTIYYNGVTANTFGLTSLAGTIHTTTSDFSANSSTSMYLTTAQVNVTSVTFEITHTQIANNEKAVGYIHIADSLLVFPRIPSSKDYKPRLDTHQIRHILSDGGVRLHNIQKKWKAQVAFKHITSSFRNSLKSIYEDNNQMFFVPFGTATGWDGIGFECVWPGEFMFYEYSDDARESGFSGRITLEETPI